MTPDCVAMDAGRPPIEPPANRWRLPAPELADDNGLCGIGADLEPGTQRAADFGDEGEVVADFEVGLHGDGDRAIADRLVVSGPAWCDPARRADRVAIVAAKLPSL